MIIDAKPPAADESIGRAPGQEPLPVDPIDTDRLIWDLEYRRQIIQLLKFTESGN